MPKIVIGGDTLLHLIAESSGLEKKKNTSIDKEESEFVIGDYTLYFLENVLNKKKSKKTFLLLIGMKNIYLKSKIKKGFYFS